MTQEFQLSVTPVGNYEYLVRTERGEPGVPPAEEQVVWPIERWLQQARVLMQDPLLQMLQGPPDETTDELGSLGDLGDLGELEDLFQGVPPRERRSRSLQNLASLGRELYSALFCDSIRDRWMMAQAIARNQNAPLRLRLGLKSAELNRLPWEALHDGDFPLAAGTQILFSRYWPTQNAQRSNPPAVVPGAPLRILMAVSTPSDRSALALPQETRSLVEELQAAPDNRTHFDLLEQPDRQTLTRALEGGQYHIFHYSGHSASGRDGGEISLVSKKHGITEILSGNDLAGMLANNGIQLAVFNSCRGAHRDRDDSGAYNLAEAAIERRIPAVLAMAERIPDEVALSLTQLFYRHLGQGLPIDLSLNRARQGLISSFGSRQFYWALPVFHLCPDFQGLPPSPNPELDGTFPASLGASRPTDVVALPIDTEARPVLPARDPARLPFEPTPLADGLLPDRLPQDEPLEIPGAATPARSGVAVETADTQPPAATAARDRATQNHPNATAATDSSVRVTVPPDRSPPNTAMRPGSSVRPHRQPKSPRAIVPLAIGALCLTVGLGLWRLRAPADPLVAPATVETNRPNSLELRELATQASVAIAQGDVTGSLPAIATLLELGDLDRVDTLLLSVPTDELERGDVQFLRGRWAWETRLSGSTDADYGDAQRYWQFAVDAEPDNLLYRTALGWAYYAEYVAGDGDDRSLNEAAVAWSAAVELLRKNPEASIAGSELDRLAVSQTLRAGVALLHDRRNDRDRALAVRDTILERDPLILTPDNLARNWLWPEAAIGQWQILLGSTPLPTSSAP